MNTLVDILIVVFIALGAWAGWKRGLIKSLVNLIGLIAVLVISYSLRIPLANFLIDKMPFFSFNGLTALNILIYNVLAFIFLFIILYCILNIIIAITGFIDTLLKFTVIWILPSKIGGAIVGFVEAWVFVFVIVFVLASFNVTSNWIINSKASNIILDHTPVIGGYLSGMSNSAREIYKTIEDFGALDVNDKDAVKSLNLQILVTLVNYDVISDEKQKELTETGKIDLGTVQIVKPTIS